MAWRISKHVRGGYYARIQIGGVRKTVYGATKADVRAKLKALQQQALLDGGLPDSHKRTLQDLVTAWLQSSPIRETTRFIYEQTLRLYVLPRLGSVRLDRITPARLEALYRTLDGAKAQLVHGVLRSAFATAVRWRWLAANPCDRVKRPQAKSRRPALWTPDQARAFLAAARDYPFLLLLATTGLRLGEALALRWKDVGLGGAVVTVRETAKWLNGRWVFNPPKTRSAARTVVLPQIAREALQRLLAARPDAQPEDFVFCGRRKDAPMGYNTAHAQLAALCKRLGLPRIRIHDLRHLHASLLLAEGVPVTEVAARLGHANPHITLRVYAHAVRDQRAAVAAMERLTQSA